MVKSHKPIKDEITDEELAFILWELEEMENFYPMYKTMIKKE